MKKPYYVVLTPFFPTEDSFNGPFIYDQVNALRKFGGYEIIVLKLIKRGSTAAYTYQGIDVYPVRIKDLPSFILPGLIINVNLDSVINKLRQVTNNDLNNIAFVHGHVTYPGGVLAVAVAEKVGAKSIVQHHGLDVMSYTNGRFNIFKSINRKWINIKHVPFINRANLNVGVSQRTLDKLHEVPGYTPTREYVLYNGVDTEKFYKRATAKKSDVFTIGCIGNFWNTKDQITLIKAFEKFLTFSEISNASLKLIGSGGELQTCKNYVNENNLNKYVHFLDVVDHSKLNSFYNSLDLFVLPSYDEAFGCVYTEAFACGVPFVGVEGQGMDEMVLKKNMNKQLITKGDVTQLSNLILDYYNKKYTIDGLANEWRIEDLIKSFANVLETQQLNK